MQKNLWKIGLKVSVVSALMVAGNAWAGAVEDLNARLEKISSLTVQYHQQVSQNGKTIQQGSGIIKLKRPNLFRIESKTPQESLLVSNGKTLWFYDPFVEQVTIRNAQDALAQTPVVLLTNNSPVVWQKYTVSQVGDVFTLLPKSPKSTLKSFTLEITADGSLKRFATTEKSGKSNNYSLSGENKFNLGNEIFSFTPPKGAEVDDQR